MMDVQWHVHPGRWQSFTNTYNMIGWSKPVNCWVNMIWHGLAILIPCLLVKFSVHPPVSIVIVTSPFPWVKYRFPLEHIPYVWLFCSKPSLKLTKLNITTASCGDEGRAHHFWFWLPWEWYPPKKNAFLCAMVKTYGNTRELMESYGTMYILYIHIYLY